MAHGSSLIAHRPSPIAIRWLRLPILDSGLRTQDSRLIWVRTPQPPNMCNGQCSGHSRGGRVRPHFRRLIDQTRRRGTGAGDGSRDPAQRHVQGGDRGWPRSARPRLRQDAPGPLHPHPPRRQGRPRPLRVRPQPGPHRLALQDLKEIFSL